MKYQIIYTGSITKTYLIKIINEQNEYKYLASFTNKKNAQQFIKFHKEYENINKKQLLETIEEIKTEVSLLKWVIQNEDNHYTIEEQTDRINHRTKMIEQYIQELKNQII